MSQRAQTLTNHSHRSLHYLAATELETLAPGIVLQRSLTTKSIVITTSSYSTRYQESSVRVEAQKYHEIGAGFQGVVYEQLGNTYVTKKERLTNQGLTLHDEFIMHRKVWDAFAKYKEYSSNVRVPQPYYFVAEGCLPFWLLPRMPENDRNLSDIVTMERILPLPKVVRRAMIQKFYPDKNIACDEHRVTQILGERANKHCLARVYLGVETLATSKESFSLRNFPLTLDLMVELGLDVAHFAAMIGNAYAIMHWAANITGDDVEFVFGTSTSPSNNNRYRGVHMYLLDFGQCDSVNMKGNKEDVFQALKGSMVLHQNQIYLPHPSRNTELYQAWKSAYLSTSRKIIRREGLSFDPEEFLYGYEEYLEYLGI
ncbi:hypothetical protein GGR53DRAFT_530386 [Hypoxylon sp. FL1150]|nr:hypothetical protein GGR53DRAFT_530386 [Hypoxylon sp. FL1150]